MLKDVREKAARAADDAVAVLVVGFDGRVGRTAHFAPERAYRQAAFVHPFFCLGQLCDDGIDEDDVRNFDLLALGNAFAALEARVEYLAGNDEDAERVSDLRRGNGNSVALGGERTLHVGDDLIYFCCSEILRAHFLGYCAQDRISVLYDFDHRW